MNASISMTSVIRRISAGGVVRAACALFLIVTFSCATALGADLDAIKKRGVLRHLGIPYANFVTGSGDGMDIELMQMFATQIGVRYEYVKTDWDHIFSDLTGLKYHLENGKVVITGKAPVKGDVAANGITILPWRMQLVDFSTPTFPNQVWVVSRADSPIRPIKPSGNIEHDISDVKKLLRNKSLLGKEKTCLDPSLYNLKATGAELRLFENDLNELAPAIINGESELTLLDIPDAMIALEKWPGMIKVIGPVCGMQEMGAAFPKDSPKLRKAFDQFIDRIKADGTFDRIVSKYYPFVFDYARDFFKKKR